MFFCLFALTDAWFTCSRVCFEVMFLASTAFVFRISSKQSKSTFIHQNFNAQAFWKISTLIVKNILFYNKMVVLVIENKIRIELALKLSRFARRKCKIVLVEQR